MIDQFVTGAESCKNHQRYLQSFELIFVQQLV